MANTTTEIAVLEQSILQTVERMERHILWLKSGLVERHMVRAHGKWLFKEAQELRRLTAQHEALSSDSPGGIPT